MKEVNLPSILKAQINGAIKNISYTSMSDETLLTFYSNWNAGYITPLLNDELISFMRMRKNKQIKGYEPLSLRPVADLIGTSNVKKIIRRMNEVVIYSINDLMCFVRDFTLPTRLYSDNLCKKFDKIMEDFGVSEYYDELYSSSSKVVEKLQRKRNVGVV